MRASSRQVAMTLAAALAGLCIAVALAVLTSHLSTQRIGLAGESPASGRKLVAPARTSTVPVKRKRKPRKKPVLTVPVATAPAMPTTTPLPTAVRTSTSTTPVGTPTGTRHERSPERRRDSDD